MMHGSEKSNSVIVPGEVAKQNRPAGVGGVGGIGEPEEDARSVQPPAFPGHSSSGAHRKPKWLGLSCRC